MRKVIPLKERPWDYGFLGFFIINLLFITYIVDLEQIVIRDPSSFTYPIWPLPFMVDIIHWYGSTFDPPQWYREAWWRATIWLDVIAFGPYYLAAIYAFIKGKEWIRIPSVIFSWILFTNVFIILSEEFCGNHPTAYPVMVFFLNLPWLITPFLLTWRMWKENPFSKNQ